MTAPNDSTNAFDLVLESWRTGRGIPTLPKGVLEEVAESVTDKTHGQGITAALDSAIADAIDFPAAA